MLYSIFKEIPEKVNNYSLFTLNFNSLSRLKKVNLWRKIYGYSQKVKNKRYEMGGLIKNLGGKKLERGVVIIPPHKTKEFKDFLHKNKINYKLIEIWTDSL